jgi:hypothetical protein
VLATGVVLLGVGLLIASNFARATQSGSDQTVYFVALAVVGFGALAAASSPKQQPRTARPAAVREVVVDGTRDGGTSSSETTVDVPNGASLLVAAAVLVIAYLSSKNMANPTLKAAGPIAGIAILVAMGYILPSARANGGPGAVDNVGYPLLTAALFVLVYLQCSQAGAKHVSLPSWIQQLRSRLVDFADRGAAVFSPTPDTPDSSPPQIGATAPVGAGASLRYQIPGVAEKVAARPAALGVPGGGRRPVSR